MLTIENVAMYVCMSSDSGRLVGWLFRRSVGRAGGWLVGRMPARLVCWLFSLAVWLAGRLVGGSVGWCKSVGPSPGETPVWLADSLVGRLVGRHWLVGSRWSVGSGWSVLNPFSSQAWSFAVRLSKAWRSKSHTNYSAAGAIVCVKT